MKTILVSIICAVICMALGAYVGVTLFTNGADVAAAEGAAAVVQCIQDPASCGLDEDDLDPHERFVWI